MYNIIILVANQLPYDSIYMCGSLSSMGSMAISICSGTGNVKCTKTLVYMCHLVVYVVSKF